MPKIQLRHDTATNWATANPVLLEGEAGYETDTNKMKIGDGTTNYNSLPYLASGLFDNKVDLDASNLSDTGKSTIASLPMPSGVTEELVFGASATPYTAPADGYFTVYRVADVNGCIVSLDNVSGGVRAETASPYQGSYPTVWVPVEKGQTVNLYWSGGASANRIWFTYAEGSKWEAQ